MISCGMTRVTFTPQLERFLEVPCTEADGDSVAAVLAREFEANPRLRGYVLDEHDCLRTHVNVFVDGRMVRDRRSLSDAVPPDGEVFVLQALSGG